MSTELKPSLEVSRRDPAENYRDALSRLPVPLLIDILRNLGPYDRSVKSPELVATIIDRLGVPRYVEGLLGRCGRGARMALGILALAEASSWPRAGLAFALAALGEQPDEAIAELVALGLLVERREDSTTPNAPERISIVTAATALAVARTLLPEIEPPPFAAEVRQRRETDGLEPILRLAALWQRVDEIPMRRTQQGTLYKRDRERTEEDPVLVGPITDSLEPLPEMGGLWLALAREVGLIRDEENSDRTVAAPASFWADNAVHLPQMVAARWLGLRSWHEQAGAQDPASTAPLAGPFLRIPLLIWLATRAEEDWVALDDLTAHLEAIHPRWSNLLLSDPATTVETAPRSRDATRSRTKPAAGEGVAAGTASIIEMILLGPAYQMGLVRGGEEIPSGRRAVQLTALGRYALALGPPPQPSPPFEHFLFVQPNFEIIAYRQGLNPLLIGQLSRFATWTQSGAALEMKLTAESIYRGLEGGMAPQAMLDRLSRHSARPLPSGVAEAVKSWSSRRDRITYHAASTLVEFASSAAMAEALQLWPDDGSARPVAINDRLLLIEDERSIPFDKFRLAGSRDYRRPPETCVEVEPDGVTLSLDLSRSDLFIDTEILRIADDLPGEDRCDSSAQRRRYRITTKSLARAVDNEMTSAQVARWFEQRVGTEVPPAVRLLLHAAGTDPESPRISQPLVLTLPAEDLLDGLYQHPTTRDLLSDRLGPLAAIILPEHLEALRSALAKFGLGLDSM